MRSHIPILLLALAFLTGASAVDAADRTWTSVDGKEFKGSFVASSGKMVTLRRAGDGKQFKFPITKLSAADRMIVEREAALRSIRMRVRLKKSDTDRKTRQTGTRRQTIRNSDGTTRTVDRPIIEKYTLSSKTLSVETSTTSGILEVGIDAYFVKRQKNSKSIFDRQSRHAKVTGKATTIEFSSKSTEDFYGWAVVMKRPGSGEIIAIEASSYPVKSYVLSQVAPGRR